MKRYLLFTTLLLSAFLGYSQEEQTKFEVVVSKNRLGLNERLRVSFEMNKDGDLFEPPAFDDFEVLMGPSQSISSSWINGKRSFSKSYTYVLRPKKQGLLEIGPAFITIEGERYATEEKKVEITAAVANPNAPKTAQDVANESLYLVASISKPNPYENEAVLVTYTLYFSPQVYINNFVPADNPAYNNFWSQDISISEYETRKTTYRNEVFNAVDLKQVVLYPQKSGELPIEPFSLELYVQIPTGRRDFFGDPILRSATKVVSAGSSVINVKALPTEGRPENFSGAVGSFSFDATADKTRLDANESMQIRVEVSGSGNLKLLRLPELNLPSSLELYEPEFSDEVTVSSNGMRGKVSDTYTVVPRYVGSYPVDALSFNYFDPEKEVYIELSSIPLTVEVENGPRRAAASSSATAETAKEVSPSINAANAFVSNSFSSVFLPISKTTWPGGSVHLMILLLLIAAPLAISLVQKFVVNSQRSSASKVKRSHQKRLKQLSAEAEKALASNSKDAFYDAVSKILDHSLSLVMTQSTLGISENHLKELLNKTSFEEKDSHEIVSLMNKVNLIKYSPASSSDMQSDLVSLQRLVELIQSKANEK